MALHDAQRRGLSAIASRESIGDNRFTMREEFFSSVEPLSSMALHDA
jgi:hypothetical protein